MSHADSQAGEEGPERAYATDFEARYLANSQSNIKSEQVREFLQIPANDVIVESVPRTFRTAVSTVPANVSPVESPLHIQDSISSFTKPFVRVRYLYEDQGGRKPPAKKRNLELTEVFTEPENDEKAFIDESLLQQYSADILRADTAARQENRLNIFDLLPTKKYPEASDRRGTGSTEITYMDYKLQVTLKSANIPAIGEVEPFFVSLTLFDVHARVPVSESFYCTFSDPSLLAKLNGRIGPGGTATQTKMATFRITEPHKDIVLLIRLEKVLMGDSEQSTSIYLKSTVKPKEKAKYEALVDAACTRLGTYTQSFAVGVIPLFKEEGIPIFGDVKRTNMVDKLVRLSGDLSDESLLKSIKSILADKFSKLKVFPCSVHFEFQAEKNPLPGKLTPTLVPILPTDPSQVIREIQEFHSDDIAIAPFSEWTNTLYVYPQMLNMSAWSGKGNARNLTVEVTLRDSDSDPLNAVNLPLIYGQAHEPNMKSTALTSVMYHAPKRGFHDEFKICLPGKIPSKAHLFFTISHINVRPKSKKEKPEDIASPVAYAVLPILTQEGKILEDSEHFLSTVYSFPNAYLSPEAEDSIKYVEKNRKPNFIVRTRLVSTINTLNDEISIFFSVYNLNIDNESLRSAIAGLRMVKSGLATKWCYVLITALCRIMSTHTTVSTVDAAFQAIMFIVDSVSRLGGVHIAERNIVSVSFIQQLFEPPPGQILLFDVLIASMVRTLQQKNAEVNEIIGRHNWFAFDMIIKSMQLYLLKNDMLGEEVPRSKRFGSFTNIELAKLVGLTLEEVLNKSALARAMSENLALFLKDLLTIYDRGLVMDLVYLYSSKLPKKNVNLRFEFLRIVCDYEHYIPLNLPLPDRITDIAAFDMQLWSNHFLSGVLVREVIDQIKSEDWIPMLSAVDTLFFLLFKHDHDTRYQHILARTCIPGIYFSFVLLLADANDNSYRCIADAPWEIRAKVLACFLWITKNMQRKILQQWWTVDTQKRITSFFIILANCINTFAYQRGNDYQRDNAEPELLKSTKLRSSQAVEESRLAAKTSLSTSTEAKRIEAASTEKKKTSNAYEDLEEQNLSREVTFTVIDLLMDFMNDNVSELRKPDSMYMDRIVINLLTLMLRNNQCQSVLNALFAAVRHTIVMFPGAFFVDQTPYGGEISYAVLRHCNSPFSEIRAKASAIFYLLLRNNFLAVKNFSRMKLQATIAVSRIVGDGTQMYTERFNSALREVSRFAQADRNVPDHFKKEVMDLTERLFTALANSIKINEFSFDPEMTADLYYEISRGYVASPDLRAAWLQNLAAFHRTHENHEEAAQCQIHLAALISVYINQLKVKEKVTVNPLQFQRSAPNSYNEMRVPKEAFEEEGICQSSLFTRNGMFDELRGAVAHLKQDSLYESCIAVQRLNIEILKEKRDYKEMGSVFADLEKLSDDILTSNQSNSRLFSNYYLVRFHGKAFQDLDGAQFIYKERQMTRLAELSSRLVDQFKGKFGECKTLGASASTEGLDPNVPHVMALTVKPYFSKEELANKDRQSVFEKQFNIKRFIYETPMTTTGAKYSEEITEQAKKKTILETEIPFPFVIKRLRVLNQTSEILSPIQTATELIEDRCCATQQELEAIPPNPKTLQIILQGSVLLQVNAGPLAIAKTFLGNRSAFDEADISRLETSMTRFVELCNEAVKLNKTLIGPDQMEFQKHLESGYESLYQEYTKLLPK